jgi:hypothetical protein
VSPQPPQFVRVVVSAQSQSPPLWQHARCRPQEWFWQAGSLQSVFPFPSLSQPSSQDVSGLVCWAQRQPEPLRQVPPQPSGEPQPTPPQLGQQPRLQFPAQQAPPPVQAMPSAFGPRSVQSACPVTQSSFPAWHSFPPPGHDAPWVQGSQLPLKQTWFVPQLVPSGRFVPVSPHTGCPLVHPIAPAWQRLAGVHAVPAVQALQEPL